MLVTSATARRDQLISVRVLDLAERITTLVEAGVWTRTTLPPQEEAQRRLGAGRETIVETYKLLVSRNVLRLYYDPEVCHVARFLPAHVAHDHEVTSRVDDIAEEIEAKIRRGEWCPDRFPDSVQMRRLFRCRSSFIREAMKLVEARGLVREVKAGRTWRWMPVGHPAWGEPSLQERVLLDILHGRWTGILPSSRKLADVYQSSSTSIRRLFNELASASVIHDVRAPGRQRAVWQVVDGDIDYKAVDHNAAVIAADIASTVPHLLDSGSDSVVTRGHPLLTRSYLAQTYHCSEWTIEVALALLAHQRSREQDISDPTHVVRTDLLGEYRPQRALHSSCDL